MMAELVDCYRGLRVMRVDPWECLVFFVLARGISIKVTHAYMEKIAEWGKQAGHSRHTFPTALQVRAKMANQGSRLKHRFPKVVNLLEMAASVTSTKDPQDRLDYRVVVDNLRKDVGDKCADCVSLFSLDDLNAFPVDYSHMPRALRNLYGVRSDRDLQKCLQSWSPYAGYASQFLFIHDLDG